MLSVSESKLAPAVILEIISDMSVQVHPPPVGKMQGGSVPSSYLLPFCPSVVDNFYLNCCQLYAECLRHSYNYHSIHIFIIAMCVFLLTLHLFLLGLFVLSVSCFPMVSVWLLLVCPYGIHRNKMSGPLSLPSMQVQ